MGTVPVEVTAVAGTVLTAATWNTNVRDGVNFFVNPPIFIGRQVLAQSVPNNGWTVIVLDAEDKDPDNAHSTVTNPARYIPQTPGWYALEYTLPWAANVTGRRGGRLRTNGAESQAGAGGRMLVTAASAFDTAVSGAAVLGPFNGTTDYAEMMGFQDSGGALNTNIANDGVPRLSGRWVSS